MTDSVLPTTRRDLLTMIGKVGGGAALYQAMTVMGHAAESQFTGPPGLSGAKPGASVLVLGAGPAHGAFWWARCSRPPSRDTINNPTKVSVMQGPLGKLSG